MVAALAVKHHSPEGGVSISPEEVAAAVHTPVTAVTVTDVSNPRTKPGFGPRQLPVYRPTVPRTTLSATASLDESQVEVSAPARLSQAVYVTGGANSPAPSQSGYYRPWASSAAPRQPIQVAGGGQNRTTWNGTPVAQPPRSFRKLQTRGWRQPGEENRPVRMAEAGQTRSEPPPHPIENLVERPEWRAPERPAAAYEPPPAPPSHAEQGQPSHPAPPSPSSAAASSSSSSSKSK